MDIKKQNIFEKIREMQTADWNNWLAKRSAMEDWIRWKAFDETDSIQFLAQIDERAVFDDELSNWRALQSCRINSAILSNRQLSGIDLSQADISDSFFDNCGLRAANFANCKMKNVHIRSALLFGVDFSNALLNDVDFSNSLLYYCNFAGTKLVGCRFKGVNICQRSLDSIEVKTSVMLVHRIKRKVLSWMEAIRGY